jgi:hypothetical protein
LHLPEVVSTLTRTSLDLVLAETNVRVEAPESVLSVLDATLSFVPRLAAGMNADIIISVRPAGEVWEIRGHAGSMKLLGAQSALPQVAGAVVSSAVSEVAISRNCRTIRASVVEKDGRALAFVGDDWERLPRTCMGVAGVTLGATTCCSIRRRLTCIRSKNRFT